jgi:hypothetical protein
VDWATGGATGKWGEDRRLKRQPNVDPHVTPTQASRPNQVKISFSILEGSSLRDTSSSSINQLQEYINASGDSDDRATAVHYGNGALSASRSARQ